MALKPGLTNEWWHGMKATICDFCGKQTLVNDEKAMLYDVSISPSDSYEATDKKEAALLFNAEDVCISCTKRVHKAIHDLKRDLRKEFAE